MGCNARRALEEVPRRLDRGSRQDTRFRGRTCAAGVHPLRAMSAFASLAWLLCLVAAIGMVASARLANGTWTLPLSLVLGVLAGAASADLC